MHKTLNTLTVILIALGMLLAACAPAPTAEVNVNPTSFGLPLPSPDGKLIAEFSGQIGSDDWQIVVMSLEDKTYKPKVLDFEDPSGTYVWSPDSTKLAAIQNLQGKQRLCILDIRSKEVETCTPKGWKEGNWLLDVSWTSAGISVSAAPENSQSYQVFLWDGINTPKQLTSGASHHNAQWAPDGTWFSAEVGDWEMGSDMQIFKADGSYIKTIEAAHMAAINPNIGNIIAVANNYDGLFYDDPNFIGREWGIWVMTNKDDGTEIFVDIGNHSPESMQWSPDGESIVFTSYSGMDGIFVKSIIGENTLLKLKTPAEGESQVFEFTEPHWITNDTIVVNLRITNLGDVYTEQMQPLFLNVKDATIVDLQAEAEAAKDEPFTPTDPAYIPPSKNIARDDSTLLFVSENGIEGIAPDGSSRRVVVPYQGKGIVGFRQDEMNGSILYMVWNQDDTSTLYLAAPDGKSPKEIVTSDSLSQIFDVSAASLFITFQISNVTYLYDVYEKTAISLDDDCFTIDFNPSLEILACSIVHTGNTGPTFDVHFLSALDGTVVTDLGTDVNAVAGAWSPDGKSYIYAQTTVAGYEPWTYYVTNIDGDKQYPVAKGKDIGRLDPIWSADGEGFYLALEVPNSRDQLAYYSMVNNQLTYPVLTGEVFTTPIVGVEPYGNCLWFTPVGYDYSEATAVQISCGENPVSYLKLGTAWSLAWSVR